MLTGSLSPSAVREARALGAAGFLLKGDNPEHLAQRVREVAGGGSAWGGPEAASAPERSSAKVRWSSTTSTRAATPVGR